MSNPVQAITEGILELLKPRLRYNDPTWMYSDALNVDKSERMETKEEAQARVQDLLDSIMKGAREILP